jgi:hypothetical protein
VAYLSRIIGLVDLVLPRFVHEGKKYATIAVGCTGGRHRSVYLVERLAAHLASRLAATHAAGESGLDWRQTVTHRELALNKQGPGEPTRDQSGLQGIVTPSPVTESSTAESTGGPSSRARQTVPDSVRNDCLADGNGQKTTPVQAQEA